MPACTQKREGANGGEWGKLGLGPCSLTIGSQRNRSIVFSCLLFSIFSCGLASSRFPASFWTLFCSIRGRREGDRGAEKGRHKRPPPFFPHCPLSNLNLHVDLFHERCFPLSAVRYPHSAFRVVHSAIHLFCSFALFTFPRFHVSTFSCFHSFV